jgi:Bacterial Ig-like domain (group 3)/FG-GAP-like repeat
MPRFCSFILARLLKGIGRRAALISAIALLTALPGFSLTPSTTTLSLTPSTPTAGQVVTLTATVQSGATNISPGVVTFYDGTLAIAQAQLISGAASRKTILGIGSHSLRVVFSPTTTYSGSASAVQSMTVAGSGSYGSATTISSSGTVGDYTLTATVTDFGRTVPSGTVSFIDSTDGGRLVGQQDLDPASIASAVLEQTPVPFSGEPYAAPSYADFNGDGIKDIALPMANGSEITVFLGKADGTFNAPAVIVVPGSAESLTTGDWNADGIPDIAVGYAENSLGYPGFQILIGKGDGTFTVGPNFYSMFQVGGVTPEIVSADVNNDGMQDLLVSSTGRLYVFTATGSLTFSYVNAMAIAGQFTVGDLNGDGFLDIVQANGTTGVSVNLNKGNGTFASAASFDTSSTPNGLDYLLFLTLGDFNNDGRLDLAASTNANHAYVALGNGDGTFASFASYNFTSPFQTVSMSVADLDGDGKLDILVPSSTIAVPSGPGALGVLYGNGDGTFQAPKTIGSFDSPTYAIVGDFNGDSIPDFAMVSTNTSVTPFVSALFTLLGAQSETATVSNIALYYGGANSVYAGYAGDIARAPSQSAPIVLQGVNDTTTTLAGSPASPLYGSPLTLTATVNSPSGQIPTGTVTFYSNGSPIGSGTVTASSASGVATLTTSGLSAGPNNITASYSGDMQNAPSSGGLVVSVAPASASVALTSSVNPVSYSQAVTFVATLGSGVTGTVTFLDGATVLGTSSITGTTAALTTSSMSGGAHSVSAQYNGDSNHSAGSSNVLLQVVRRISVSITISSSKNPSIYHDSVMLSFAVAGVGATPTGTLSIADGGTNLGTVTLDASGHVSLSFSTLQAGSHGLVCTYNGDSNYF